MDKSTLAIDAPADGIELLDWQLERFDYQRWTIVCRSMMIRIVRGEIEGAVDGLRQFSKEPFRTVATLDSPVTSVLPVRIANYLEEDGYFDLRSVADESDDTLREIENLGPKALAEIRDTIDRVLEGAVLDTYFQDDDFVEEELCVRQVPAHVVCNCKKESTMTNEEKVLDALETLAGSPDTAAEVLDKKIATLQDEVNRLKRLRSMIAKSTESKTAGKSHTYELTPERKAIADRMFQNLTKHGPRKAGLIADDLNVHQLTIGKIAKADSRFVSSTGRIELAS
jgi:hypothetical protein